MSADSQARSGGACAPDRGELVLRQRVIVDRMRAGTGNYGFDAAKGQYVDLIEAGIIDPTKVVRIALENAVSVASLLLLAEATLTEIPESKPAAVPSSEL